MITKVQEQTLSQRLFSSAEDRLTGMEKAMLRWVTADPGDRVLDASTESGRLMEYMRRNMLCDVCGVSDDMNCVRSARAKLRGCDIMYASIGDIPWKEDSFDTVLLQLKSGDDDSIGRMLCEAGRVLRPGGQLVIGLKCMPEVLRKCAAFLRESAEEGQELLQKQKVEDQLSKLLFEKLFWQRTALNKGVLIAWKPNGETIPEE